MALRGGEAVDPTLPRSTLQKASMHNSCDNGVKTEIVVDLIGRQWA